MDHPKFNVLEFHFRFKGVPVSDKNDWPFEEGTLTRDSRRRTGLPGQRVLAEGRLGSMEKCGRSPPEFHSTPTLKAGAILSQINIGGGRYVLNTLKKYTWL